MKKPYQKPTIARRKMGISSKFVENPESKFQDRIEDIPITQLVEQYGSPLFVYSYRKLKSIYETAYRAFSKRYPKVHFAWSYKTNYLQAICKAYHNLGSRAEVVSEWEYDLARSLGNSGDKIIFNGPYKSYTGLKRAIQDDAIINIDSFDEIYDIEQIAGELDKKVEIGMRVNMHLTTLKSWDRFGLNIESGQANEAVKRIVASERLSLRGLHSHIGTFVLNGNVYGEQVAKMLEFIKTIRQNFGIKIQYIDIGGGFASHNKLKESIYPAAYQIIPSFDQYAEAICPQILNSFPVDELPTLYLETGRALVDEAGYLITTVVASKRMTNGRRMLILDGGVNLLFTAFWYDHQILPVENKEHLNQEQQHVYGPLCMQIDVVCDSVNLPYLEKGDQVVVHPVGAYNNTQWMQFIHLRPNVVMIGEDGSTSIIREAETTEYVRQPEKIPEWLKSPSQKPPSKPDIQTKVIPLNRTEDANSPEGKPGDKNILINRRGSEE